MFGQKVLVDKLPVTHLTERGYETLLSELISRKCKRRFLFVNTRVWHFYNTERPGYLRDGVLLPDGAPLRWIINAHRGNAAPCASIPGIKFFHDVMCQDYNRSLRHAFVGTNNHTLALMRDKLNERYPGIQIVSMLAPDYGAAATIITSELSNNLIKAKPDIVWVGLGAPKQDEAAWIMQEQLGVNASFAGVGLVFDYIAGTVHAPPQWVNSLGIEWAYRVLVQPKRTINFVVPFLAMLRLVLWRVILRQTN